MRWARPTERTVATIGYPGHGKTVFLASLFWDSLFTLSAAFGDERQAYSVHAMSEEGSRVFHGNAKVLNRLELPPPNPRARPEPAVLEFRGVPRSYHRWWRSRQESIKLTFYDMAGELATNDEWLLKNAPFLPHADDIIFLFDPTRDDFSESVFLAGELCDRIYRVAPQSRQKHFIVALSKIDELRARDEWLTRVTNQDWFDYTASLENLTGYLRRMEELSRPDVLRLWWADEKRQVQNFVNGLPKRTHYCALSSLGHQPVWDCPQCGATNLNALRECGTCAGERANAKLRLTRKPEPLRVRDPLFWIFREAGIM